MAWASIPTKLSLDRYAQIMRINPVHFNGANQIELADGRVLFPLTTSEQNIWPQYSWQNSDQVSREELAQQIYIAEQDIEMLLGYHLAPEWEEGELYDFEKYHRPDLQSSVVMIGSARGLLLRRSKFIAPGRRAISLLGSPEVSYLDTDGDGWCEKGRITLDISAYGNIDVSEIKVYLAGNSGDPNFEVRPLISKAVVNGIFTADINAWQLIEPNLATAFPDNEDGGKAIEIDTTDTLVKTVEVYREYNSDLMKTVSFLSGTGSGNIEIDSGYIKLHSDEPVCVIPVSATLVDGVWVANNTVPVCNYVKVWYYSGNKDKSRRALATGDYLDDYMAETIAILATARLGRPVYANQSTTQRIGELQLETIEGENKFVLQNMSDNPFGTKKGEVVAWNRLRRLMKGRGATALV